MTDTRCPVEKRSAHACFPVFDNEDQELSQYKWRRDRDGYPVRTVNWREKGRKRTRKIGAHRDVMFRVLGRKLEAWEVVDHINFDLLDNRRDNLRLVTKAANSQHRQAQNATGIRGVAYHKKAGKWQAAVRHNRKTYYCGLHATPELAGKAAAAKRNELGFPGGIA